MKRLAKRTLVGLLSSGLCVAVVCADQVIMKDGTVYKGKITIDTDKELLIGNPPFDPVSYLLETKDIDKIIYEEYHPLPPAERKRGFGIETRLTGNIFSSSDLTLHPAPGLYAGGLFRVHPLFELEGGVDWIPSITAGQNALMVNGQTAGGDKTSRQYQSFWSYSSQVGGRFYPFFKKKWKTEPYLTVGYGWSSLIPNGSGDRLKGDGWHGGFGFQRPLTTHLFWEARWVYESMGYDSIRFLGQDGALSPTINERHYEFTTGMSYRL